MNLDWRIAFLVFPAAAYAIGATPFGVLLARPRAWTCGTRAAATSGRPTWARVLGRPWGYLCFVLDAAKGFFPVLAAGMWLRPAEGYPDQAAQAAWLLVACGAICGHVFNPYLRFRGGKGVATGLGVVLGVWPYFTVPGEVRWRCGCRDFGEPVRVSRQHSGGGGVRAAGRGMVCVSRLAAGRTLAAAGVRGGHGDADYSSPLGEYRAAREGDGK